MRQGTRKARSARWRAGWSAGWSGITTAASLAVMSIAGAVIVSQHSGLATRFDQARVQVQENGLLRVGPLNVTVPWAVTAPPAQPFATGQPPGWSRTDDAIAKVQEQLNRRPESALSAAGYSQLASLYLQKARETGNPDWYSSADTAIQKSLDLAPGNVLASLDMGSLLLSRHHFSEALEWGQKVVDQAPGNYAGYGILTDALTELGRYDEAVVALQTMVDLRPDQISISRVSYARELHGDLPGAIDAMSQAVASGAPASEGTNWSRVQLGNLYFLTGQLDEAERQYRTALLALPNYAPALGGLANIEAIRGKTADAIAHYTQAQNLVPLVPNAIALADLYRVTGNQAAAARQEQLVRIIAQLQRANGLDVDLDMGLFEVDHADNPAAIEQALETARTGYQARPQSIHAADVMGWALYRAGKASEALPYVEQSLRLGTADPMVLYHAGTVMAAAGDPTRARHYLEQALAQNDHFNLRYAPEAQRLLAELKVRGA